MRGLLLIALALFYVGLCILVIIRMRPLWGKATLLALAILIPSADSLYYQVEMATYCKNEAGIKIFEIASRAAGLVDREGASPGWLEMRPLAFVEGHDVVLGTNYRLERKHDGSSKKIVIEEFTAPYEFLRKERNNGVFLETELIVRNMQSGKILGRLTDLNYYGGWLYRIVLGGLSDSGPTRIASCGIVEVNKEKTELINRVFSQD